jgi:hypothetical protein
MKFLIIAFFSIVLSGCINSKSTPIELPKGYKFVSNNSKEHILVREEDNQIIVPPNITSIFSKDKAIYGEMSLYHQFYYQMKCDNYFFYNMEDKSLVCEDKALIKIIEIDTEFEIQ